MDTAASIEPPNQPMKPAAITPEGCGACDSNGIASGQSASASSFVYALGRVNARFPSLSVEKEFQQIAGRVDTTGQTEGEMFHSVLSQREHRYLLRKLCWVLTIQGLETYLLQPAEPSDLDLLLSAIRPAPSPLDIDAVIGMRGPIASPDRCNGLMIPVVTFDQIYSFDREALIKAIPRPEKIEEKAFEASARELFERVMLLTDNAGATDDHRALNYLAMRYHAIYKAVADAHGRNASLTGVDVRLSNLSTSRKIVEVVFSFTNRNNEFTEKFFTRVDVTEEFPFLVSPMVPYYDR